MDLQLFKPNEKWKLDLNPVITISISLLHFFVYRFHFTISPTFISPSDDIYFFPLALPWGLPDIALSAVGADDPLPNTKTPLISRISHIVLQRIILQFVFSDMHQLFSKWKKNEKTFFFSNGNSIYLPFFFFLIQDFKILFHFSRFCCWCLWWFLIRRIRDQLFQKNRVIKIVFSETSSLPGIWAATNFWLSFYVCIWSIWQLFSSELHPRIQILFMKVFKKFYFNLIKFDSLKNATYFVLPSFVKSFLLLLLKVAVSVFAYIPNQLTFQLSVSCLFAQSLKAKPLTLSLWCEDYKQKKNKLPFYTNEQSIYTWRTNTLK